MIASIIKKIHNRCLLLMANLSYENKRKYLAKCGAKIGFGTRLNCNVSAFGTEPYLISVGENCLFAANINLITHDGGIKVLNALGYFGGKRMDNIAPIVIGNNVYIGMGAYIMPGVHIGDNVIVGAGAIVTKDIPSNSVCAGIPARVIKTIDEYYQGLKSSNRLFPTPVMSSSKKREYLQSHILMKKS